MRNLKGKIRKGASGERRAGAGLTQEDLRRYAVGRSLFRATTLGRALARMGFVQADPIRAPARAQDLILRPRVKDYRAGELERRYESLGTEEDFFVNYGYVTRSLQRLMHPRPELRVPAEGNQPALATERARERLLLDFVAARGTVHPREVEAHFAHGTVRNYWGGSSRATTQMLDGLHYRGLLRVRGVSEASGFIRFIGMKRRRWMRRSDGPGSMRWWMWW